MRSLLIVATLGRDREVAELMASLAIQSHRDFRVVVIDQNADDRLVPIIATWKDQLKLEHIRCEPHGVSAARNLGLETLGDAELVAFPDDDCVYEPCTLARAIATLEQHPDADVAMGRLHLPGELGTPCPETAAVERPSRFGILRTGGTPVQFFRRRAILVAGGFDLLLGPGAGTPWVSGEDSDYLMRAGGLRQAVVRSVAIRIFHPPVDGNASTAKAYGYGRGRIRILRKHNYPAWFIAASVLHPLFACALKTGPTRSFRWHLFRGRLSELMHPYQPTAP